MTASAVTVLRTVVGRLDVVRVPCPLCGESGRVLLRKNGMAVESCHRCGFLFVNPRPSPRALARMYNDDRGEVVAGQIKPISRPVVDETKAVQEVEAKQALVRHHHAAG